MKQSKCTEKNRLAVASIPSPALELPVSAVLTVADMDANEPLSFSH